MLLLEDKVSKINRIGATTSKKLNKIDIETINDLLFYFPIRYDDFSEVTPIEKIQKSKSVNIVGKIEMIQNRRAHRRKIYITEALISDESGIIKVIWFNQPFIARNLKNGDKISLAGKIEEDYTGYIMKSPVYEKITSNKQIHTQGLVPNYRLTSNLTQKQIRFLIKQVIGLTDQIIDWVPKNIIKDLKLLSLGSAIKKIHFPENKKDIKKARERLAFNELFLIQLQSQLAEKNLGEYQAPKIKFKEKETKNFVKKLPFKLTNDQKKCSWQIIQDLKKEKPMTRLLEGDVGSGKTVVAIIAMLNTALNKKQSVLMAPTEILAKQHFNSISKLLFNTNIKIGVLTRSIHLTNNNSKNKKDILKSDIIIGTHALIQEKIDFSNLGLVVIDEQHRFGVEQRKILLEKGNDATSPHLLSMTATPIPRSLALALYGNLDISVIKEMPEGRKKIITNIIAENKRQEAYNFIRMEIKKGRQAFVICPLIDPSDKLGVKSVKEEYERLNKIIFPDLKINFLHGRLKTEEKEKIMKDFSKNKTKILVSTSVVEVGVDIPNASIMMIEGADRFGLAQLHQFRGRVGRSKYQSYCLLFTNSNSPIAKQRLSALEKYHDGFTLAKIDLKFRGPGEVFGTAQKGFPVLKMASLFDYNLMEKAKEKAKEIIKKDPNFKKSPYLQKKIKKNIHLE